MLFVPSANSGRAAPNGCARRILPCSRCPNGAADLFSPLKTRQMTPFLRRTILALFLFMPLMAPAQASSFTDKQKAEIERIIHDYLVENPEVLVKAFEELERRTEDERVSQTRDAVKEHSKALYDDAEDFVAGNPKGDVTLVEFFDYRCGYCRQSFEPLMDFV